MSKSSEEGGDELGTEKNAVEEPEVSDDSTPRVTAVVPEEDIVCQTDEGAAKQSDIDTPTIEHGSIPDLVGQLEDDDVPEVSGNVRLGVTD